MLDLKKQNKLFKKYKGGNSAALIDFIEMEKPYLYDYLLRMCGQVGRSTDTIEEVMQTLLTDDFDGVANLSELRILLFKTARNFLSDIWNANTTILENEAYEDLRKQGELTEEELAKMDSFEVVDNILRGLSYERKEIIILKAKNGFEFDEISKVTGKDIDTVEELFESGITQLTIASQQLVDSAEQLLPDLPHHPTPILSVHETMNLSVLMKNIKEKPKGLRSPTRIALLIIIVGGSIAYYYKPELFVIPDFIWNFIRTNEILSP